MRNWGFLKHNWHGYQILNFYPNSNFIVEFLVFLHIYLLAAFLAIKEAIFDSGDRITKIRSNLVSSEFWNRKSTNKNKNRRKILIVGGEGTIGSEIVKFLLKNGDFECHVAVHHKKSIFDRKWENDENVKVYEVDLTEKEQIHSLADLLKPYKFHVAIFSAGTMLAAECRTADGTESHVAINVIGQLSIFELLRHQIDRSLFLSSATAKMAIFSKNPEFLSIYAGPYQAYATSKLLLAVYVREMVRRRPSPTVTLHPGTVPGGLYRNANRLVQYLNATWLPYLLRKPETAAILSLFSIFRPDFQNGHYYEDLESVEIDRWIEEEDRQWIYEKIEERVANWTRK